MPVSLLSSGAAAWSASQRPCRLPLLQPAGLRPSPLLAPWRPRQACSSSRRVSAAAGSGADRAPPPLAEQHAAPAAQQQHAAEAADVDAAAPAPHERWVPASWLSGWKGAGSLLLSLGAVTGGGLLGACSGRGRAHYRMRGQCPSAVACSCKHTRQADACTQPPPLQAPALT